jgi:DNA-binding MarR family transcriptional regulator
MTLENDIKQKQFKNEYQKLAVNIAFTHYWISDKMREVLKPYDISIQQFNILRILRGQHPNFVNLNFLSERMLDKSSDASRLVTRLCEKNLVDRKRCPSDRRAVRIYITQEGLDLLANLDFIDDFLVEIMGNISLEKAVFTNEILNQIRIEKKTN